MRLRVGGAGCPSFFCFSAGRTSRHQPHEGENERGKGIFCKLYIIKRYYYIYDIFIFADYCKIIITYMIYHKIMLNFAMSKQKY